MTTFKSAVPVFAVADVAATARWYQQHFGFQFHHFPEREPWEWAAIFRDSVEIMLQRVANHKNPDLDQQRSGGVWDAYIRISDARGLYERVKDKVSIRRAPCPMPYGELEFEMRDPNGYILVFAERATE
jgi:catechol 2,3-dioxygenase-like lactoylglutathione lyase family enzyme